MPPPSTPLNQCAAACTTSTATRAASPARTPPCAARCRSALRATAPRARSSPPATWPRRSRRRARSTRSSGTPSPPSPRSARAAGWTQCRCAAGTCMGRACLAAGGAAGLEVCRGGAACCLHIKALMGTLCWSETYTTSFLSTPFFRVGRGHGPPHAAGRRQARGGRCARQRVQHRRAALSKWRVGRRRAQERPRGPAAAQRQGRAPAAAQGRLVCTDKGGRADRGAAYASCQVTQVYLCVLCCHACASAHTRLRTDVYVHIDLAACARTSN